MAKKTNPIGIPLDHPMLSDDVNDIPANSDSSYAPGFGADIDKKIAERSPRFFDRDLKDGSDNPVKFADHEGNPARFTTYEAWWFINGAWHSINSADITFTAEVLTREEYERRFHQLPALPSTAFRQAFGKSSSTLP